MLVLGALPLPYGYYTLLRLIACSTFVVAAYLVRRADPKWLVWVYGLCALLFNPLIKVHFQKGLWSVLDLAAAGVLLASTGVLSRPEVSSSG